MFNSTFVFYIFNKLNHYCSRYHIITSSRLKGKIFKGVQMVTRVYPCFTKWHSIFYVNNKKVVPVDLYNMLTYEALAYWIMGYGTRSKKIRFNPTNTIFYFKISSIYYKYINT